MTYPRWMVLGLQLATAAWLLAACGGAGAASPPPTSAAASTAPAAAGPAAGAASAAKPATSSPAASAASARPSAGAPAKPSASPAGAPVGPTTTIRFGTIPSIASEPMYLGADSGQMSAQGLNVTFESVTSTPQTLVSVAAGQLDMGISSISAAFLNALARGTDLKVIASGGVEAPGHAAFLPVLARADLYDAGQLKSLAQLKDHKVALNSRATGIEFDLYKALKPVGLKVSDVDIVVMPWPDMVAALGNKSIDAGLIAQPLATQAIDKGLARILADDYAPGQQNAVMVANSKFLADHAEAATRFLQVYVQAIRRLNDGKIKNDAEALASVQKWTKTAPEVVKKAPNPHWAPDGKVNVASIEEQQTYYLDNKEVDYAQRVNIASVVDERFLDDALKRLGG